MFRTHCPQDVIKFAISHPRPLVEPGDLPCKEKVYTVRRLRAPDIQTCMAWEMRSTVLPQQHNIWLTLDLAYIIINIRPMDLKKELSGKNTFGGVRFIVNYSWWNYGKVQELKSFCSPDLEYLTIKCITSRENFFGHHHGHVIASPSRNHNGSQGTTLDFVQSGNHISWGRLL